MSTKRTVRKYNQSFIREAIQLLESKSGKVNEVADSLGIPPSTLRQWYTKSQKDSSAFAGADTMTKEQAENHKLRKELSEACLERDILKKAVAIFSKPQK